MADKANLLGKRKAEDGLKTEPLLRRHKEKETRQGLADSTLKGTAGELSETKADERRQWKKALMKLLSIDFFKDVGQVVRVRLLLNARGKHVGYGFVEFASSNQAKMEAAVPIKTLFIASFPRYSTEISDIIDFFKDVGQVVRVRLDINDRGKFVGCGFVDFASANQANKALQNKNGEYLHDRKIFLADGSGATFLPHKFCIDHKVWYEEEDYLQEESLRLDSIQDVAAMEEGPDETPHSANKEAATVRNKTLFVSGLSRQTKISEIINFFKDVGEVVHVRLIVFRWGNLHGKGFVEFASANEAMKALEKKNGEYLNGRDVFLAYFETPPYHRRPKYFIDHKVWYQDYLQRESLEIKEDVAAVEKGLDVTPHFTEEIVRKKTVFVDGLSYNTRISDIINFFKDVREEIIRVRFIVDGRGDHVGCCFVEMATANAAKKAVQENYNTSKFFVYAAEIAAQCPFQPKYKLADLAEKLWYEDSLRQKSLCGQKLKPILNENKEAAVPIRTLFIASLSRHSTDISDIIDFFKDVGQVVRVRLDINDRGKLVGCGYVEFASANQANKALQNKNGEYLHDRKIFLADGSGATFLPHKFCIDHKVWYEEEDYLQEESLRLDSIQDVAAMEEGPDETPHSANKEAATVRNKTLFVSGLSRQTKISEIINFFKDVGEVVHVRLIVFRWGNLHGKGFVEFASANEAMKALEKKNGEYLNGRDVFLAYFETPPYHRRPKYFIDHKVWYQDYLQRESLEIKEDVAAVEKGLDVTPHFTEEIVRKKTVFVDGLSYNTRISDIINFFKDVREEIIRVRFIVDGRGDHVGCCFVEMATANAAKKAVQENYNTSKFFVYAAEIAAQCPFQPKYKLADLAEKLWYEDSLRQKSLCGQKLKPILNENKEAAVPIRTLFIASLSRHSTDISDIIDFFKDVGQVVRVRLDINDRGKLVGCGYVEFASANQANKALQNKNGEYLHDRKIFLADGSGATFLPHKFCIDHKVWYEEEDYLQEESLRLDSIQDVAAMEEGPDETPHSANKEAATVRNKTLFVSGLSRQTKISEIINFFKDVGEVVHVRLIVFRWGNLHGKGFVEFASANEAMKALEKKNGEYLNGRDVFLAYFETPPYHRRPKYFIDHKVWYQDYLQRESLEIKEDVAAVEKGLDETPHFTEETVRKKTVFVDGLSYNTSISDIINFFKDVREEIIRVRLIVDGRGDHVGCCFVEMATANAAKKAVQENYNTSKFFVYAAEIAAPYPFQPKYKLADLAEKLWYEDSLCEKSLFGQKPKPILSIKKVMEYGYGKKTTFSDDE
ncbi:hypothetical protein YC2023_001052 [Brassica napus]